MELLDPATGRPLPPDSIQRVLFVINAIHVYNIPPLASMRGHNASSWTTDPSRHIFTGRLRLIETSSDAVTSANIKVDAVLEDLASGQLFAAAPYTDANVVEPAVDSSRFFALTVRDDANRKAVLGIGFEERSDAFDFAVALQEARKALGWEGEQKKPEQAKKQEQLKDYSLKEGETITVNLGGSSLGRRRPQQHQGTTNTTTQSPSHSSAFSPTADSSTLDTTTQPFALPPPPPSASSKMPSSSDGGFALPPPPSAQDVKRKRRSLMDLGFDDGQFGEFA